MNIDPNDFEIIGAALTGWDKPEPMEVPPARAALERIRAASLRPEWDPAPNAGCKQGHQLIEFNSASQAVDCPLCAALLRADGMERAGAEQASRADQNRADMLRYREGCALALPALELASAFIRGIYKADVVEELSPESMNEAEVSVGKALDYLRALNP